MFYVEIALVFCRFRFFCVDFSVWCKSLCRKGKVSVKNGTFKFFENFVCAYFLGWHFLNGCFLFDERTWQSGVKGSWIKQNGRPTKVGLILVWKEDRNLFLYSTTLRHMHTFVGKYYHTSRESFCSHVSREWKRFQENYLQTTFPRTLRAHHEHWRADLHRHFMSVCCVLTFSKTEC